MKTTLTAIGVIVVLIIAGALYFNHKPLMTNAEATQIIQHQYVKNPTFAIPFRESGDNYIVAVIDSGKYNEPTLITLKQIADLWQEQPQTFQLTCSSLDCASDAKKVSVAGHSYVFFTTESSGSSSETLTFSLFSPADMYLYSIDTYGANGDVNQVGEVSPEVKNKKEIYDYLIQQISVSPKIAHTSQQNLDVNAPENAVQKWQLDNPNIWTAMTNYAAPVKFTYYDQNLFSPWEGTSVEGTIENSQFKFIAYFKGVVVGEDKIQNKYFILYVPQDMYEWPTNISFIDPQTVHLDSANNGPSATVYLDSSTITSP